MALFAETEEKIFGEILFDVVNNTNITRSSPGSKTRALAQATSKKMGQMYRKFDVNIVQAFLDGATGKFLDFIGDMMGLERLGAESSKVSSSQKNIKFFVEVGNFGDINSGDPINLPSNTIISTSPGGQGIAYKVPFSTILSPTLTEVFLPAESIRPGSSENVGPRQLINHNFTDYSDVLNDSLKVTNEAEVSNGQDVETDTNYRFRIANQVVASEKANITAVRIAALSVPGVADIVVIPFFRGIGTIDLLIKAVTPSVSVGLLAAVEEAVLNVTSQGIVLNVRGPQETGLSLTGTLTFRRQLPTSEQTSIIQAATDNIIEYTNSLDIGEDWIENEAIERTLATSEEIKNVGIAGKPFDFKFIFKSSKLEDNKIRSNLIGDYIPEEDERVIVENQFAGSTPIFFRAA